MIGRKRNKLALGGAAVVAGVLLYLAAFGPMCWISNGVPESNAMWSATGALYGPVIKVWCDGPEELRSLIGWYANLGATDQLFAARLSDGRYCLVVFR
jgi:hypothetical protein